SHAAGVRCLVPVLARGGTGGGVGWAVVGLCPSPPPRRPEGGGRGQLPPFPKFPRHDGRPAALSGDTRRCPADESAIGSDGSGRLVRMRSIAVRLSSL